MVFHHHAILTNKWKVEITFASSRVVNRNKKRMLRQKRETGLHDHGSNKALPPTEWNKDRMTETKIPATPVVQFYLYPQHLRQL